MARGSLMPESQQAMWDEFFADMGRDWNEGARQMSGLWFLLRVFQRAIGPVRSILTSAPPRDRKG